MDLDRLFALHAGLPRQGPGSDAATQDALRRLRAHGLPDDPVVLDIGCGEGRGTLLLGRVTGGRVTGIDVHEPYLDTARARIAAAGLGRRVTVETMSMFDLDDIATGSLDLIWGEGSIYIIGFADGLRRWKRFLKPGGFVGVTELSWLTGQPPEEAAAFWAQEYPGMADVATNRAAAESLGYTVLDSFPLPREAWWDEYYAPLEARIAEYRDRFAEDGEWMALLDATEAEIDVWRRFGDRYAYVFYLMRRDG